MDDQNQNTNPQQQLTPGQEIQRVVQPTIETSPAGQIVETSQPTSGLTNNMPPAIQQKVSSVYPSATVGDIGKPPISMSQANEYNAKSKKGSKLFMVLALIIGIAVVLGGTFYFLSKKNTEPPIKTDNAFSQYTFTNDSDDTYKVSFYKNSTTKEYNFGSSTGKVLISPSLSNNSVPIYLSISGRAGNSNASAQNDIAQSNDCSLTGQTEAFKVYIQSLSVYANFCTISSGVGYESFFGNASSVYFMQILPAGNSLPQTTTNAQRIINSNPSSSDVKTIAQSFMYVPSQ